VRAWAVDSFATFAGTDASLQPELLAMLVAMESSPHKSLSTRATHIRERLQLPAAPARRRTSPSSSHRRAST
jgi:hypothetical protein